MRCLQESTIDPTSASSTGRPRDTGPRRAGLAVALTGILLTLLGALWVRSTTERENAAELDDQAGMLRDATSAAIHDVVYRLQLLGGLFRSRPEVTLIEFRRFVADAGTLAGMDGMAYMPIVAASDLEAFESKMNKVIPGYLVFEPDAAGDRVPVAPRPEYYPVQWFEPTDRFRGPHGLDAAHLPNRREALDRARATGEAAVTAFLQLVADSDDDGFLVIWPVADPDSSEVVGFTAAPMDLSDLLAAEVPPSLQQAIKWTVTDVTGAAIDADDAGRATLAVGGRIWSLAVTPAGAEGAASGTEWWVVLAAGIVLSVLAGGAVYLLWQRTHTRRELDRLRDVTLAKDELLASVSHELRTPLTAVLGFSELLKDAPSDLSADDRQDMIRSVADQAGDLAHIIEDLLVAARVELDQLTITRVPVALRAQAAQVLEAFGGESDVAIEVDDGESAPPRALADPARVRQILRNLLSNAGRYGGPAVRVRIGTRGDAACLEVADDGPGIPAAEQEAIFQPHYSLHTVTRGHESLGIGLAIARQLARLMDGDLTYSRREGWTVFELTLPRAPEAEVPDATREPAASAL